VVRGAGPDILEKRKIASRDWTRTPDRPARRLVTLPTALSRFQDGRRVKVCFGVELRTLSECRMMGELGATEKEAVVH
jgi:hypothetical protein